MPTPHIAAQPGEFAETVLLPGDPLRAEHIARTLLKEAVEVTRVRAMSVQAIALRLNDRFRLLRGGDRTALPRQQTLRALIDWSYDLLGPQQQALFRRLAVFAGGFTLAAAEEGQGSIAPREAWRT